jgi:hypothetical protein
MQRPRPLAVRFDANYHTSEQPGTKTHTLNPTFILAATHLSTAAFLKAEFAMRRRALNTCCCFYIWHKASPRQNNQAPK